MRETLAVSHRWVEQHKPDPRIFMLRNSGNELVGLIAAHVDDILPAKEAFPVIQESIATYRTWRSGGEVILNKPR